MRRVEIQAGVELILPDGPIADPDAIAQAVRVKLKALEAPPPALFENARAIPPGFCPCGCGRELIGRQKRSTPACRKRLERRRKATESESP